MTLFFFCHRREGFAWSWLNELYGSVTRQNRKHFLCYEKKKKFRPTALRTFCRAVATLLYKSKKVWEKSGRTYAQNHALLLKTKMHTHKTFLSSLREGGGRGGNRTHMLRCHQNMQRRHSVAIANDPPHILFHPTTRREHIIYYRTVRKLLLLNTNIQFTFYLQHKQTQLTQCQKYLNYSTENFLMAVALLCVALLVHHL